jgi:hypothetical protein
MCLGHKGVALRNGDDNCQQIVGWTDTNSQGVADVHSFFIVNFGVSESKSAPLLAGCPILKRCVRTPG